MEILGLGISAMKSNFERATRLDTITGLGAFGGAKKLGIMEAARRFTIS